MIAAAYHWSALMMGALFAFGLIGLVRAKWYDHTARRDTARWKRERRNFCPRIGSEVDNLGWRHLPPPSGSDHEWGHDE